MRMITGTDTIMPIANAFRRRWPVGESRNSSSSSTVISARSAISWNRAAGL